MSAAPSLARRVGTFALYGVVFWAAAVASAWWYLDRNVAPEHRMRARPLTDADSYGLPLLSFAIWLGILVVALNVAASAVLAWRDRRARQAQGPRVD